MDTLCLGFYTLVIVLGASKEALAAFSNASFKDDFGVHSIRVFSNFLLDPYYEPLLWFMISFHALNHIMAIHAQVGSPLML